MAYPLLSLLQPIHTIVGPLEFHSVNAHPKLIFLKEFVSTLVLILAVEAVPYFRNPWTGRSFISVAIRCIANYAGKHAAFNPLVPLCWIIFSKQLHEITGVYFVVYFVAPMMGAMVGALIFLVCRDYGFVPRIKYRPTLPHCESLSDYIELVVSPVFLYFFVFVTGAWASYCIMSVKI